MRHRTLYQQANQPVNFNKWMQRFFIWLIAFACLAYIGILAIDKADTIDNNGKVALELIGVLFLLSCAAYYLLYRIKGWRN